MGIMQKNNRLKGLTRLLLLLGFSIASMSAGAQTPVTSLSDIISANGNYRLDADIDASGFEGFSFTFRGTLDGGYHTISGLTQPLFTTVDGGTVNNAVFDGGLGAGATVTANPTVNIGGTGANRAVVGGRLIDDSADGKGDVFGGGSEADVLKDGDNTGNTSVTLSGNAEVMGNVYGGGNKAAVEGDTEVNM